ncbi:MAG: hypothetical protein NW204_03035 [Xanthomonadaceae bacterium]|nr:hypothetical protein [Xanthomonadaceae bacterium]
MGRSFKAPAARDLEQWAKVKALYDAGFRFFSYRGFDCPPLPARLADLDAFIRDNLEHPLRVGRRDAPSQRHSPDSEERREKSCDSDGGSWRSRMLQS